MKISNIVVYWVFIIVLLFKFFNLLYWFRLFLEIRDNFIRFIFVSFNICKRVLLVNLFNLF